MNQIPSSDEIVEGGMNAAATDAVLQPNAFVITPFKINVPQSALDDLKRRLEMTRWPTRETVSDWSQASRSRGCALWSTTGEPHMTGAVARRCSTPSAHTAPRLDAWSRPRRRGAAAAQTMSPMVRSS